MRALPKEPKAKDPKTPAPSLVPNPQKNFTHVLSARNQTLTVFHKKEIELVGGVKTSVRKFGAPLHSQQVHSQRAGFEPSESTIASNICRTQRGLSREGSQRTPRDSVLEENVCVVCYANESDIVIMSCGHSDICEDCGKDIWKTSALCFICQQDVDYLAKIQKFSGDVVEIKYCIYMK